MSKDYYDSVVLIGAILNKADTDCSNGVMEACTWLIRYGIPMASEGNLGSVTTHLKRSVTQAVKRIETGELLADYSLDFNAKSQDDKKTRPLNEQTKHDIEKMKVEIAKNPQISNSKLAEILNRSETFVKNHREKLLAEKPI